MHTFVVCACKFQDFAQSQKIFARSHDREIVTFRNSVLSSRPGWEPALSSGGACAELQHGVGGAGREGDHCCGR